MKKLIAILLCLFLFSPVEATITDVQHTSNSGASVTTATGLSVTLTSTGSGHLLVASCGIRDNTPTGDTVAVSDNQSEVWTSPAASAGTLASLYSESSFYVLSSAAGVTTVTFKPSGGGGSPYTSMWCFVAEYSTTGTGFVLDSSNYTTGTTASNTESGSITTTKSNDVIFSLADNSNNDPGAALTGFTNLDTISVNGSHQSQEQLNAAAATYTPGQDSASITNGNGYGLTVIAIGESNASGSIQTTTGAGSILTRSGTGSILSK